jgi:hypothetical protein
MTLKTSPERQNKIADNNIGHVRRTQLFWSVRVTIATEDQR